LEHLTISKIGHLITLQELFDIYQKHFICCTYNYDKKTCEYIDYKNNPNLSCIIALKMTSNLPFLFHPFYYNNCLYMDGAIYNNFPIECLEKNDIAIGLQLKDNISPSSFFSSSTHFHLMNYIYEIINIPIHHIQQKLLENLETPIHYDEIHIYVSIPLFHWNINMNEKFNNFSIGYETMKNYFQKLFIIVYEGGEAPFQPPSQKGLRSL
jgi:predicted acylesterase/phospholipase RssA